jgi:CPA1 family monovalent cation:H+ antiporter
LLTILINGSTIKVVLARLGYDKPPLFEQLAIVNARAQVVEEVERRLHELSHSRDLRAVDWTAARTRLGERRERLEREQAKIQDALSAAPQDKRIAGYWGQALDIELQAYWEAFANGTLAVQAVKVLDADIGRHRDRLARGNLEPQHSRTEGLLGGVLFNLRKQSLNFNHVAMRYDLWRAEGVAAERVLGNLHALKGCAPDTLDAIRATYQSYLQQSKARLEDLRTNLPEMTAAIETRLAQRIELNLERDELNELEHRGVLDHARVHAELEDVEDRMNALKYGAERVEIPETAQLVAKTRLFQGLDPAELQAVAELTEEMLIAQGDHLFKQGDPGEALYVIARGALQIVVQVESQELVVDVLGGGDVVGEMALLTGAPRSASAIALTSVTLGKVDRERFETLTQRVPGLIEDIWRAFAERVFDNHLRDDASFSHLSHKDRIAWFRAGRFIRLESQVRLAIEEGERVAFIVHGTVLRDGKAIGAVELLRVKAGDRLAAKQNAVVCLLGDPRASESQKRSELPPAI